MIKLVFGVEGTGISHHNHSDDVNFVSTCAFTISREAGRERGNCTQPPEDSVKKSPMHLPLAFYFKANQMVTFNVTESEARKENWNDGKQHE